MAHLTFAPAVVKVVPKMLYAYDNTPLVQRGLSNTRVLTRSGDLTEVVHGHARN
jgi:hypothetical protein